VSESCKRENIKTPNFNFDSDDAQHHFNKLNFAKNTLLSQEKKDDHTKNFDTPNRNPINFTDTQTNVFSGEKNNSKPKKSCKKSKSFNNVDIVKPFSIDNKSIFKSELSDIENTKSTIDSKRSKKSKSDKFSDENYSNHNYSDIHLSLSKGCFQ